MFYLLRNYVELAYLFIKGSCEIDYFLFRFEVSKYEYKNDILRLKEMAPNYGVMIHEDQDCLKLKVVDDNLYEKMCKPFFSCYYIHRFVFNDNDQLIKLLISSRLLDNHYFIVEKFAEEFGYSKSNLRNPLKKARTFLQKYSITTLHKPYYGLYTEGNEFDIRICLCDIYVRLMPEIVDISNKFKIIQNYDYAYVHHEFVKFCINNNVSLSANDRKSICNYLTITKDRLAKGKGIDELHIEDKILVELSQNAYLRNLAHLIFDVFGLQKNDKEIAALMVILFIHNVNNQDVINCTNKLFFEEKETLKKQIFENVKNLFGLDIKDSKFLEVINHKVCGLVIKKHTNKLDKITDRISGRNANVHTFPLCYAINSVINDTVSKFYNISLESAATESLADIFYYYIESLESQFKKYNIAIGSRLNNDSTKLFRDNLVKEIDSKYINSIETYDFIQLSDNIDNCLEDIDLIIVDSKFKTEKKLIIVSDVKSSIVRLEAYLRYNRDMCKCLGKNGKIISKNLNNKSDKNFEELLSEDGMFTIDEIHRSMLTPFYFKGIMLLLIPTKENDFILQLGEIAEPMITNNHKINNYIIMKCGIDETNAKVINILLHELIDDPIFVESVKSQPSMKTLNEHINMILK